MYKVEFTYEQWRKVNHLYFNSTDGVRVMLKTKFGTSWDNLRETITFKTEEEQVEFMMKYL